VRFLDGLGGRKPLLQLGLMWRRVDSAWEQKKLEVRKMLENAAESPPSSACFVGTLFAF
jgi:hypothetical protein